MIETPYTHQIEKDEDEIDLIALAKKLWSGRKTILMATLIGTVIGVFVAIVTPPEFTVKTIMVPQTASKSQAGGLSGLAALAGIDIGTSLQTGEISPILYPQIVSSTPFKLELMNTPIKFKDVDQPVSLFDYYTQYQKPAVLGTIQKYTLGLPGMIVGAIKGKKDEEVYGKDEKGNMIVLTKDQNEICKALDEIIILEVDAKQGYLTLVCIMPDAFAAAQLAQIAQELLQREIIRFKVQKSQADLEFIQERYNEVKAQAEGYQVNIAQNTDKYKNLTSAVPQVQTTRIQTKYGVANTVFQELAKQLEQAKIQVKKDTPVFTIIQPVSVPVEKSKPNRPLLLVIFVFMGAVFGVVLIFGKVFMLNIRTKWKEDNQNTN